MIIYHWYDHISLIWSYIIVAFSLQPTELVLGRSHSCTAARKSILVLLIQLLLDIVLRFNWSIVPSQNNCCYEQLQTGFTFTFLNCSKNFHICSKFEAFDTSAVCRNKVQLKTCRANCLANFSPTLTGHVVLASSIHRSNQSSAFHLGEVELCVLNSVRFRGETATRRSK